MAPTTNSDIRFENYKASPSFCIITPTAYLEQYASQSNMHLVLAHLVETDDRYARFYNGRDEFKIMDNGAFELGESYDPDSLIRLATTCKADVIVLPDYPGQSPDKTIDAAAKFAPIFKAAGFKTMFVPQGYVGDAAGWQEAYEWATVDNDLVDVVGMSILGIPNALPHVHKAYARVVMTERLMAQGVFGHGKAHHYLGLNAGPNLEIPTLLKMGAMTSCDSSGPVWSGICGNEYSENSDSFSTTSKIKKHVDFGMSKIKDANVDRMIQRNIDLTMKLFK